MAGVNLSHSTLKEADLSFTDMFCANLEWSDSDQINFFRVDLRGANCAVPI